MKIDYNDYDPRYRMSWAMGIMQRYDGDPEEAAKEICQLCDAHMEAHKPAHVPQPVGEWVTVDDLYPSTFYEGIEDDDMVLHTGRTAEALNKRLTKKYGHPPIVRTYKGEPASEWGLEDDDFVLWWHVLNYWTSCRYSGLAKGDRWLPMLPAPKGGAE